MFRWVFERRAEPFEGMSDLPKGLRQQLDDDWTVFSTRVVHRHVAPDGTDKLLLECRDGRRIECVLMAEDDRRTVCISTQVGCGMGCVFCASGLKGVERNLTQGEIVEQVLRLRNLLPAEERLTNLVVMGMGESLANLDNLIAALDRICSRGGPGAGPAAGDDLDGRPAREDAEAGGAGPTVSPGGLAARADRGAAERAGADQREGRAWRVMEAADAYFRRSGRQVTFEYVLLRGVNDRAEDARALAELLEARKAHVNLIPYNPVAGLPFERPSPAAIRSVRGDRSGRVG